MEQRKVLLIIASVTLVLAAFLGVGMWLYYPGDDEADQVASTDSGVGGIEWEPLDFIRGDEELPGLEASETDEPDEFEVTYGVSEDAGADESVGTTATARQPSTQDGQESAPPGPASTSTGDIVITTVSRSAPAQSAVSVIGEKESAPVRSSDEIAAAGRSDTSDGAPSAGAGRAPIVGSAERAAAAAAAAGSDGADRQVVGEGQDHGFWVQMISSPRRDTVEQAQRTLRTYQLGTTITTKQIDDTLYYRLRLGPFAVRDEAEKFLAWVQEIPGFESSMIFLDYTTRVAGAGG